jgi:predicted aspartyl protease
MASSTERSEVLRRISVDYPQVMRLLLTLSIGLSLLTATASAGELRPDARPTRHAVSPPVFHSVLLKEQPVRVRLDRSEGHLAVEVLLDDQGPFRFLVDTGSGVVASLDHRVVAELGLAEAGQVKNGDGSPEQPRLLSLHHLNRLELGGAVFSDLRVMADDYSWLPSDSGLPVHGLLGFPLFRHLLLTLDLAEDELRLEIGELEPGARTERLRVPQGVPLVRLEVAGRPRTALLDTGNSAAAFLPKRELPGLRFQGELQTSGRLRTVLTELPYRRGILRDPLRLGGLDRRNLKVGILDRFPRPIIGLQLLDRRIVTFDQLGGWVRFEDLPRGR